jgi:hypothetical protein
MFETILYAVVWWTPNVRIPDQTSKASPALAAFQGRLHMVHLGDSSNDIWHSVGTANPFERFGPKGGVSSVSHRYI